MRDSSDENDDDGDRGGDGDSDGPAPHITLIAIGETYWIYEGEEFLTPLIGGQGFVPLPVRCYIYADIIELRAHVGKNISLMDYWGLNPDVVDRLRRDNHLLEFRGQSPESS